MLREKRSQETDIISGEKITLFPKHLGLIYILTALKEML